jgi:hypothetical protein
MPKKDLQQQQEPQRVSLGPFEVDPAVRQLAAGEISITIESGHGDSFHIIEEEARADRPTTRAYRTVQRIDLATRLQLPADYDPADLVGRTFLVEA